MSNRFGLKKTSLVGNTACLACTGRRLHQLLILWVSQMMLATLGHVDQCIDSVLSVLPVSKPLMVRCHMSHMSGYEALKQVKDYPKQQMGMRGTELEALQTRTEACMCFVSTKAEPGTYM